MLVAGEQVEDMISQLGREKRLDTQILRAIDRKMGIARKNVSANWVWWWCCWLLGLDDAVLETIAIEEATL